MTTLVLGATGNTGKRVVSQLLEKNQKVHAIVRSKERMYEAVGEHSNLAITESTVLDMNEINLHDIIKSCSTVVCCLGHNMTLKGMYGQPRKLVTDTVKRVVESINIIKPTQAMKFILMGSDGVSNPDGNDDKRTFSERVILRILRTLVPPVVDNEKAAEYVHTSIGKTNPYIKWVVIRPDDLVEGEISDYELFPKPMKGLFGDGQSSRANVAHCMVDLISNDKSWTEWEFKMPVLENKIDHSTKSS